MNTKLGIAVRLNDQTLEGCQQVYTISDQTLEGCQQVYTISDQTLEGCQQVYTISDCTFTEVYKQELQVN